MRKRLFLVVATSMILLLCACSSDDAENATTKNNTKIENNTTTGSETKESTLSDLADYLLDKGVVTGSSTSTAADLISAEAGFKYVDSSVEVYEYDTNSDAYKTLVETNQVELQGFNMTLKATAIKGKYVLFCEDAANKADIISAFNDFE